MCPAIPWERNAAERQARRNIIKRTLYFVILIFLFLFPSYSYTMDSVPEGTDRRWGQAIYGLELLFTLVMFFLSYRLVRDLEHEKLDNRGWFYARKAHRRSTQEWLAAILLYIPISILHNTILSEDATLDQILFLPILISICIILYLVNYRRLPLVSLKEFKISSGEAKYLLERNKAHFKVPPELFPPNISPKKRRKLFSVTPHDIKAGKRLFIKIATPFDAQDFHERLRWLVTAVLEGQSLGVPRDEQQAVRARSHSQEERSVQTSEVVR